MIVSLLSEPNHERALSNLAYFDRQKIEKPDEFIDQEVAKYEYDRLDMTEREIYEATCREGKPYVSVCVCVCVYVCVCVRGCMCEE